MHTFTATDDPLIFSFSISPGEKAISIEHFVGCDTIDPRYFSGSNYYLLPDGVVGQRPYNLLTRAMRESKRYGFATVFFSGHDQLVLVRPIGKVLVMSLLNYEQEMKPQHEFEGDVADVDLPANEMKLARTLIDAMSVSDKEFDYASYRDTYQDNLRTLGGGEDRRKRDRRGRRARAGAAGDQPHGSLGEEFGGRVEKGGAAEAGRTELGDAALSDAEVASWADQVRRERRESAPWHYVNIPIDSDGYDPARDGKGGDNVIDGLSPFSVRIRT